MVWQTQCRTWEMRWGGDESGNHPQAMRLDNNGLQRACPRTKPDPMGQWAKTLSLRCSRVNPGSIQVGATGPPRDGRMEVQSTKRDCQDLGTYTIFHFPGTYRCLKCMFCKSLHFWHIFPCLLNVVSTSPSHHTVISIWECCSIYYIILSRFWDS